MVPPTARPNRTARSTAPRLSTGNTPGSAMSIADACVLGAAPNAVGAPEKIFDAVESCACASRPMTTSQVISRLSERQRASSFCERGGSSMPVGGLLVSMCDVEQRRFGERVALELETDRQAIAIE